MEKPPKFLLPPPNFSRNSIAAAGKPKPHFLTPSGMTLLPREKQPPPMYGPRGSTVPPKYLRQQKQQQHHQQQKIDRGLPAVVPSAVRQFCEACELDCATKEDLERHRAQHERCPVDGCNYHGHPKVMDKHVTALHSSGLFEKFRKLSTPEEIAAWRAERRKRYPTVANVEMRKQAQEQRQKRGERLEANRARFGKREDRRQVQPNQQGSENKTEDEVNVHNPNAPSGRGRKRRKNMKNQRKTQEKSETKNNKITVETNLVIVEEKEAGACCGVEMFRGTGKLKDYNHAKKKEVTNALTSLLGMYGSDDDESDGSIEEKKDELAPACSVLKKTETKPPNDLERDPHTAVPPDNRDEVEIVASKSTEISNFIPQQNEITIKEIPSQSDTVVASSDEGPDEAPVARSSDLPVRGEVVSLPSVSNEPPNKRKKMEPHKPRKVVRKSGLNYHKANQASKQNTMLAKLLEGDIRHERNVLLQCVRFVCESKFFGVGDTQRPLQ